MTEEKESTKTKVATFAGTYGYIMFMNILSMLIIGLPSDMFGWLKIVIQALFVTGGLYGANEGINWVYSRKSKED